MNPRYRTLAAGLVILAAITGIYWFQSAERKAAVPPPGAAVAQAGVSKDLAKGALAAFIVRPQRPPVADIAFQDGGGAALKLSQWRGRVVLVNLWATWCAPCRKEMPALAELQKQLGSADFEVVAISIDRKGAAASAAFMAETGAQALTLYVEPTGRILNDLEALGLPATVLIDRHGNEVGRLLGPAEWASPEAFALIRAAIAEGTSG
ncbi:MAG: TlpA family protein disulfide reductase [Hyphomicrobiales bacterium]